MRIFFDKGWKPEDDLVVNFFYSRLSSVRPSFCGWQMAVRPFTAGEGINRRDIETQRVAGQDGTMRTTF
jgi:hypothetical protein